MINVLNMTKTGVVDDLFEFKFDFEFDNASTLPTKFVVIEQQKYLIANDSTAKNLSTNTYYKYNSADVCWVRSLAKTPTPTPKDNTQITENGNYNIINNSFTGYNDISVNVEGSGGDVTLIEKSVIENGVYLASEEDVDGYSKVTVDVPNTYTAEDEGKVVDNGALVAQTALAEEITENGTINTTLYDSVTVNVSSGGGGFFGSDVIFYDYDGTVVASYSAADFANLSALPANPTHTGLTAQGWNWSLADAKAYVANHGKLNVGQMYITSDGKTRLYYVIPKDTLTRNLYLTLDEDTELDIDWGDGTEHTIWTSNDGDDSKSHEYSDGGRYTVAITVVSGSFSCQSSGEDYILKKVELGNNVTSIGDSAFSYCSALSSVTIPNSVTSIGEEAFNECYALLPITIPNSVTSIGENAFSECRALTSITIPNSVTGIGGNALRSCSSLTSITIPDSVTSIESGALINCSVLTSITIPNTATSIGEEAFSYCFALTSIIIPNTVTSIGGFVFYDCRALTSITFESTTPPALNGDLGLPTTCVIRVPQGTLSAYTSASNYPDPSTYIYEEY